MNVAGDTRPLTGRGIVVTRPAHQAAALANLITAAGGSAILFPAIEIVAAGDLQSVLALIDRLDEFDFAIFISPNAVDRGMQLIRARRELPPLLKLAAIGAGSAQELARFGVADVIAPARHDSEALLDMSLMRDVAGKRIAIFRGEGGREVLGATLIARGASVEYAQCYRRARPHADAGPLIRAWEHDGLHAITVTSSEGLRNLLDLLGKHGQSWQCETPLFVPHPRIGEAARDLGCSTVVLTAQGDQGLVRGLTRWFAGNAGDGRRGPEGIER